MLRHNRCLKFATFLIFSSILLWLYTIAQYFYAVDVSYSFNSPELPRNAAIVAPRYLVQSENCKIPYVEPNNSDTIPYMRRVSKITCSDKRPLTYVEKNGGNSAILRLNESLLSAYSVFRITCCYSLVERPVGGDNPDDNIVISECQPFENNATFTGKTVITVRCWQTFWIPVYENVHAIITAEENSTPHRKQTENAQNSTANRPLSVLFIGIDSISALNFARTMPETRLYLENNGWIGLRGYNKIADNTFPNLMAILTGMNETHIYRTCNPKLVGKLEDCDLLWYTYRKLGYVTAYAEDEAKISTFNYMKKGFSKPPTDYYFRPYILAAERLKVQTKLGTTYCTGPEATGERILDLARDFSATFAGRHPSLGFFWMNTFSHEDVNGPRAMDLKVKQFLVDLSEGGASEDSVVIFISDHGFRFGEIRFTYSGWLEERLPFVYLGLPKWFARRHEVAFENLKANVDRLTTPYDLYMTLQDILVLSGYDYEIRESSACSKCRSLFEEVDENRSCEDAAIERHWCTCGGYSYLDPSSFLAISAANFVVSELVGLLSASGARAGGCAPFTLQKIVSAGVSRGPAGEYLLVILRTRPEAVFEATVALRGGDEAHPVFKLQGNMSRIDQYGPNSDCVADAVLKKYCYCWKSSISTLRSAFCALFDCS